MDDAEVVEGHEDGPVAAAVFEAFWSLNEDGAGERRFIQDCDQVVDGFAFFGEVSREGCARAGEAFHS